MEYEFFISEAFLSQKKINQEVRNIWKRFSHPNRPFKTTLCTFSDHWCFCHSFGIDWWHSSYSDFITCKPWHAWFVCYFINEAEATKCLEHIEEFRVGSHFALFCFTKSTHLFRRFFASGRSSSRKGVACKIKPSCTSGQQHIFLAYFACYSKILLSGSPKWDTGLTSQALLVPVC